MLPGKKLSDDEDDRKTISTESTSPLPTVVRTSSFISPRWSVLVTALSSLNIIICLLYVAAQVVLVFAKHPYGAVSSGLYGFLFFLACGVYGLRAMVVNTTSSVGTLNVLSCFAVVGSTFGLVVHIIALNMNPCDYSGYEQLLQYNQPNRESFYRTCYQQRELWRGATTAMIVFDGLALATNISINGIIAGHMGLLTPIKELFDGLFKFIQANSVVLRVELERSLCLTCIRAANIIFGIVTVILQIVRAAGIRYPYNEGLACANIGIVAGVCFVAAALTSVNGENKNTLRWWNAALGTSGASVVLSVVLIVFSAEDIRLTYYHWGLDNALIAFGCLAIPTNLVLLAVARKGRIAYQCFSNGSAHSQDVAEPRNETITVESVKV